MKRKLLPVFLALVYVTLILSLVLASCKAQDAHEHSYSDDWSYDETYHWHNATCAHLTETADKAEHTFDTGVEVEATFDSAGYVLYTCTVCGYRTMAETSPALTHHFSDTLTYDENTHWYPCTDAGYENLRAGEETHTLVERAYDEVSGYATYTCDCGYSKEYLRTTLLSLPTVASTGVYIGQTLSDLPLHGGESNVEGSFTWTDPDTVIDGSGEYGFTFTPSDAAYAPLRGTVWVTAEQLTVTVSVGENGSASVNGAVPVNYGSSLTIDLTPSNGYTVGTLTVDGSEVTPTIAYTFENITAHHTLTVTFTEGEAATYTITYVSGTQNAYTVTDNTITFTEIDAKTVYAIAGSFNGNIVIDVGDTYKFDLELTGFTLTCASVNPITILSGDEVSLTAKSGTENFVYDKRDAIDETDTTLYAAAIYSLVDLEICGKGSLTLVSENNNGIHTKDDLKVKNLTLSVTCKDNALKGNDSVEITNANTTLIATQGDCIKTTNSHISETTSTQKGTVTISGGTHSLYAACDGIDAAYDAVIENPETVLNIYTDRYSAYSEEVTAVSDGVYYLRYTSTAYRFSVKYENSDTDVLWVNVGDTYETVSSSGARPGQSGTTYYYYSFAKNTNYARLTVYLYDSTQTQGQDTDYYACSESLTLNSAYDTLALTVRSGSLSVSWTNYTTTTSPGGGMGGGMPSEGNSDKGTYSTKGIKAANEVLITAGTVSVKSYDDAIHAGGSTTLDNGSAPLGNVTVRSGDLTLFSCDDGIHADGTLTVTNGIIRVTNAYEGLEGAFIVISGGNVSVISSDDGINGTSTSGNAITIAGGTVYVYANGDGIDSNSTTSYGGILFTGGNTVVICTSSGNSAIDSEKGYTHTGGSVIALATTGAMTGEMTNGNTAGMTTKSSLTLSNGGYLTVTVDSVTVVTVKMPCAMTAYAVWLGSSSATIASATSSDAVLDADGVCWASD